MNRQHSYRDEENQSLELWETKISGR